MSNLKNTHQYRRHHCHCGLAWQMKIVSYSLKAFWWGLYRTDKRKYQFYGTASPPQLCFYDFLQKGKLLTRFYIAMSVNNFCCSLDIRKDEDFFKVFVSLSVITIDRSLLDNNIPSLRHGLNIINVHFAVWIQGLCHW